MRVVFVEKERVDWLCIYISGLIILKRSFDVVNSLNRIGKSV